MDTPYPHVYVNILNLDGGQYRTQLLKCSEPEQPLGTMDPPVDEPFDPASKDGLSKNWISYLKKK